MFIQVIQGRCTRQDEMHAAVDRWLVECGPGAAGWLGGTYGFTDDDVFCAIVRFDDEESARRNSMRPEQGAWWSTTEPLFDGPVEFHDCPEVMMMLEGGSDDAGFVQVIRGHIDHPEVMASMLDEASNMLRQQRPDVLGSTIAIEPDGTFTETVAFRSEDEARTGEKTMGDTPDEMMTQVGMHMDQFLDLHHPWFASR